MISPNVQMHLNMFGSTRRIMENDCIIHFKWEMEKLERITTLIRDCRNEIKGLNDLIEDKNSYVHLFHQQAEKREELKVLHQQLDRLNRIYNSQLIAMKL